MIETKRITAAEARGLMKPTEKEEFMLSRIYLAIENVARKRKRKLFLVFILRILPLKELNQY